MADAHAEPSAPRVSLTRGPTAPALVDGPDMRSNAMTWWLRLYLLLGTVQGMGMGLTGLFSPTEMQIPLRISPLNTRVAAAMYTAAALGLLIASFGRRAHARILVFCFVAATTLIFAVNLLHWQDFMAPDLPHRGLWIGAYIADPILGALVIAGAGYLKRVPPAGLRTTSLLYALAAVVMVIPGVLLLFAPHVAAAAWPWALPQVLAQVYGCFFLAFALAAALASREPNAAPRRTVAAALLALSVLVLSASLLHLDRFKPVVAAWLWFGGFGLVGTAFGVVLLRDTLVALVGRGPVRAPATAPGGETTSPVL